jgi:hypothetical protein
MPDYLNLELYFTLLENIYSSMKQSGIYFKELEERMEARELSKAQAFVAPPGAPAEL